MDNEGPRERNRRERMEFLRRYVQWVRSVDNRTWSSHQAVLVNALVRNAVNFQMTAEQYLAMKGELRERPKKEGE